MNIKLKYGDGYRTLNLPEKNILAIVEGKDIPQDRPVRDQVAEALNNPIGCQRLSEIAKSKNARSAVIIVNDFTRAIPYFGDDYNMLIDLASELEVGGIPREGIRFLVATGTHRPHTDAENLENFGREVVENYQVISHNCDKDNVYLATMSSGHELWVDKVVVESDVVVGTGMIAPHYYGGISGGRKSILPGVVGRETIRANHAMIMRPGVGIGALEGNPIAEEMMEAARKAGLDFILNVIFNKRKEIILVVAGDMEAAFNEGVRFYRENFTTEFDKLADVAIMSAGGYPKDVELYQVQKALNNTKEMVKPGGTIICICEAREGIGSANFEKWLSSVSDPIELEGTPEEKIVPGGNTAVNTAVRILSKYHVILITDIPKETVERIHFNYASDLDEALKVAYDRHGEDFKAYVIPQGGFIFPRYIGEHKP